MDLDAGHQDPARIHSYGVGQVTVARTTYAHSILIVPDRSVQPWPPARFEDLEPGHFAEVAATGPEIVLVGTGKHLRFPGADVLAPLRLRGIGLEVMDTGAACRSFNFLLGEGRRVAAALLMIED